MSEKPDRPVPDPDDAAGEAAESPAVPGERGPAADAAADSASAHPPGPIDADWAEQAGKLDDALDELRGLGEELSATEPVPSRHGSDVAKIGARIADIGQAMEKINAEIDKEDGEDLTAERVVDMGVSAETIPAAGRAVEDVPTAEPAEAVPPAEPAPVTPAKEARAEQADEADVSPLQAGTAPPPAVEVPMEPPGRLVDQIVAGVLEPSGPGGETAGSRVSDVQRRVREQSESELGRLWGSVFFSAEHPAPKVIIVTAARRGDGATQIATSLALVGAEASRERRIALVDFNLRQPGIANALGVRRDPGLTDALDGKHTLEAVTQQVTLRNGNRLDVVASGPPVEKPLGLLKSRQVQSLIGQLEQRYDHTILDVAPANEYPDPQVLGELVDGVLLVVRSGGTPRELVAEAKKRLESTGGRWLGLVLNQRSDPIPGFLYRMT